MAQDNVLGARLNFIGLDERAQSALRELKPLIEREISGALAGFYDRVRATPETRKFFSDEKHIGSATARQKAHWSVIAQGDYSETYVQAVRAIGETHARIGLEPRWYIGGYALVSEHLIKATITAMWPKGLLRRGDPAKAGQAVTSLVKAVLLDMDFAISIYLETIETERRRLEVERVKKERSQAAIVAALSEALRRVVQGDVTARLNGAAASDFRDSEGRHHPHEARRVRRRSR